MTMAATAIDRPERIAELIDWRVAVEADIAARAAAILVDVDTEARTATAAEIPLGILTALIGAPVFGVLLRQHFRRQNRA